MQTRALLILSILVLAACSGAAPDTIQSTATPPAAATDSQDIPTAAPTRTPTISPTREEQPGVTQTSIPSPTPPEIGVLCTPLEIHPLDELPEIIGDGYDPPRPGREERHHGIDFGYYHYQDRDSMLGEPVQSVLAGKVASVLTGQYPYGNMVIVETRVSDLPGEFEAELDIPEEQSLYTLYAHLDQPPEVNLGDQVMACQSLGVVGMSGNTDIPHLHIETRWGPQGQKFESMRFYDTRATQAEMDAYVLWRTSGEFQHFDPLYLLAPQAIPETTPEGF